MCLRNVCEIFQGTSEVVLIRFKVFLASSKGELYPIHMYNPSKGPLPFGEWLDEKDYRPIPQDRIKSQTGTIYPTGWHVYLDKARASDVASVITARVPVIPGFNKGVVLKVYCKGFLASGEDVSRNMNEVYRYIKIEKEVTL